MTRKAILRKHGLNTSQGKSKKSNGSKTKKVKNNQVVASSKIMYKSMGHCGLEKRGEFCKNATRSTNFPYDYCPSCLRGESQFAENAYPFL